MPKLPITFIRRWIPVEAFAGLAVLVFIVVGVASLGHAAVARASDEEVRIAGSCGRGASAELRLKADDGTIRVRFRLDSNRSRSRWQVALIHEGRVAWRGGVRSDGGGSIDVGRRLRDLGGADQVTARALGPTRSHLHRLRHLARITRPRLIANLLRRQFSRR